MKLTIETGVLYADNLQICFAEVKNDGCTAVQHGAGTLRAVRSQYSPAHGAVLPNVDGLGWLANHADSPIILGRVRARSGTIACKPTLNRLIALIEQAEDNGKAVTLEIV